MAPIPRRRRGGAGRSVKTPSGIPTVGRDSEAGSEPGGLPLGGSGGVKHRPKGDANEPLGGKVKLRIVSTTEGSSNNPSVTFMTQRFFVNHSFPVFACELVS